MAVAAVGGAGDVFISHSRTDVKSAEALERLLTAHGRSVWRDERRLRPGEHVDFAIPAALRDAAAVVTLWSADSASSDWVRHETSYALIEGKCVTLSIGPFDVRTLSPIYRPIHCGDLAETLVRPRLLLERLDELTDAARRGRARRVDVSRMPTTYAALLFGREREMADLFRAWHSHGQEKTNIVALDAMGGTGKTALVHHFVESMGRQGWRGAEAVYVWSFYSQGTDQRRQGSAEQFLASALAWFGHDGSPLPTQHDKGVRLAELVAGQRTLLVLDGLEPLQHAAGRTGGGRSARGITGALKEAGLAALFKQLAVNNPGLLIVTTRLRIPDLQGFTAPGVVTYPVDRIATDPGVALLESLGVAGDHADLAATVEDFRGHALALTSLGRYLATHFEGDVRRRDTVPSLMRLEGRQERDPFRVMMAYEILFRRQVDEQRQKGQSPSDTAAAKQLALLLLMGLFDRPAERAALDALLAPPAIAGLTDGLTGLSRQQWDTAVQALRALGLMAPRAKGAADDLDAHPLVREFFGARLSEESPEAWRQAHTRLWHHYLSDAETLPAQSVDAMMPAVQAVTHAALAGAPAAAIELYQRMIKPRINANGLYALDISVLLNFFAEPWRRLVPGIAESKQTMLLAEVQNSLRSSGRLAEAAEAIEHNCTMLRARQKWRLYLDQRVEQIRILIKLGRLDRAIHEATAAIAIADSHEIRSQHADLHCFLGQARHMAGDVKGADRAFHESNLAAKGKDPERRLSSFRQFAMNEFYLDQGSKTVVRTWTKRTLATAREATAKRGVLAVALDHLSLGRLSLLDADARDDPLARAKDLELAGRYTEDSLVYLRTHNHLDELPSALVLRASHRRRTGRFADAGKDLAEALHIAEHFEMPLHQVDAQLEAARLELASRPSGFDIRVVEYLDAAEKLVDKTGYGRRRRELLALRELVRRIDPPHEPAAQPTPAPTGAPTPTPTPAAVPDLPAATPTLARRLMRVFRRR